MKQRQALTATLLAILSLAAFDSSAQDTAPGATPAGAPQVTIVQAPAPPPTQVVVPGYPQPGFNPDGHLPSSSRSSIDTSRSTDGFDLLPDPGASETVRGGENSGYVIEGQIVPEMHTVRSGDTLWDISGRYYRNPYGWPRLWAQNAQIQNPHWIYPGDQVRLRDASDTGPAAMNLGLRKGARVPPQTVFLRDVGWLDDKTDDVWGEVVGSPSEKMMLSEGDDVYVKLGKDKDGKEREVAQGQTLVLFRPLVTSGAAAEKGTLVSIRGTVRIDRINKDERMARGRIIESIDVIERGAKAGPVDRSFLIVPPVKSDKDLQARIIAALYPHAFYGTHQVVFLDKGKEEGVVPGMRFFGLRRGDRWRFSVRGAGKFATVRPVIEDDRPAKTEDIAATGDDKAFPDETYAEVRVLRVREHTSTAVVTASSHEIERNAYVVARRGY
ncbi:MAG: LysM peptidoglycan-binding domain-containing protein [Polyangiaceae bacterium]|nr:LysM peptidoglycan-binding domain-containing protein [Polyangiaceae bacterium]